ncbi:MAG: pyruvate kinase [Bdellovibrionales bacterium RIFOXYB1_FULL_37_110]|nr:MAG: pyruvate kinase [Bdellovibrionales bacterium RIFOXYA1_FULL_38_20]OFZ49533.1 MAG: pyruvate kinase [Bdellovibrionales bacterium RIFOXYC1_FULL_37_79]OFZ58687.1 MAG: pyruvate kinase [Bdellovibrionales bacterium RIFOXYB1_FULL_37_110]OFZ63394.1 MAG: pyruvate kinase [Bdellovibrionales bacterium RIFOXYD1_FULL_36_51]
MRLTKIVATIGPASNTDEMIKKLIEAGMNVARLNFSHGTYDDHKQTFNKIRSISRDMKKHIGILQDLSGPKIRVGVIKDNGISLAEGDTLILSQNESDDGTNNRVYIKLQNFHQEVKPGERILLADGLLELEVQDIDQTDVITKVLDGGLLSSHKGVNLPQTKLSLPSLTQKDKLDLEFGLKLGVDMVALSFVRTPDDIRNLKELIAKAGKDLPVIAKIEKPEALDRINEILFVADGIMIARGDLAIETPLEKVPIIQKELVRKARTAHKLVIVATQMLESMTVEERPTRAEITDVANAVFDGTGAVMLSGETAVGKHPDKVVSQMVKIVKEAEKTAYSPHGDIAPYTDNQNIELAAANSSATMANAIKAKAVFALTMSGRSASLLSCQRLGIPVIAFSAQNKTLKKMSILFGVHAVEIQLFEQLDEVITECVKRAKEENLVVPGDYVVVTAGYPFEEKTETNLVHALKIL